MQFTLRRLKEKAGIGPILGGTPPKERHALTRELELQELKREHAMDPDRSGDFEGSVDESRYH